MLKLKKITVTITVSRDEDSGDILLNGFGPKSSMAKAYRAVLHGAYEDAVMAVDHAKWVTMRAEKRADAIMDIINNATL